MIVENEADYLAMVLIAKVMEFVDCRRECRRLLGHAGGRESSRLGQEVEKALDRFRESMRKLNPEQIKQLTATALAQRQAAAEEAARRVAEAKRTKRMRRIK